MLILIKLVQEEWKFKKTKETLHNFKESNYLKNNYNPNYENKYHKESMHMRQEAIEIQGEKIHQYIWELQHCLLVIH